MMHVCSVAHMTAVDEFEILDTRDYNENREGGIA